MCYCRVIDVGSEWRTFSNEKGGEDRSRVGGPENTLLGSSDLTTMIGRFQLTVILALQKYKILQVKNSFASIVNVLKLFQLSNGGLLFS